MAFYDKYEWLCKKNGITPTQAAKNNSVPQSSVAMWKKRGSTPKAETVQKLADYFGVSTDYLLGKEKERVIIPGRLKIAEVNDPDSDFMRYDIDATDQEAFRIGMQIFEKAGLSIPAHTPQAVVMDAIEQMTPEGQQKVADYATDILPTYRRADAPAPSPEGKDTTAAETPTEGG